jgi:hypothetical protein
MRTLYGSQRRSCAGAHLSSRRRWLRRCCSLCCQSKRRVLSGGLETRGWLGGKHTGPEHITEACLTLTHETGAALLLENPSGMVEATAQHVCTWAHQTGAAMLHVP